MTVSTKHWAKQYSNKVYVWHTEERKRKKEGERDGELLLLTDRGSDHRMQKWQCYSAWPLFPSPPLPWGERESVCESLGESETGIERAGRGRESDRERGWVREY